jgi:branched-chain amino acid transport system ATP-binding protein
MLTISGLCAGYGHSPVLHGVDLAIGPGEVVSLMGRNGMGKTTTIRALLGLLPSRGSRSFAGRNLAGLPPHAIARLGIGLVPEGRQVFPTLTVRENLLATARPGPWTVAGIGALFPRLAERAAQPAATLSGGEQQMLAIGRCLMGRPEMILFDEPSLGLAPTIVRQVIDTIVALNGQGMTCVLVEQNVAISLAISTQAYVLENGRITLSGTGDALLADDRVRAAYLGM